MKHLILVLAVVLASCHDQRPPAPTAEQSEQLNEAEDMLNEAAKESDTNAEDQSNTAQ